MIPYYHLYQAKKSLELSKETIKMMGDSSNYMLEAQKDMLELEVEHFRGQSKKCTKILLLLSFVCVIIYFNLNGIL
jgi:hypothetical protein